MGTVAAGGVSGVLLALAGAPGGPAVLVLVALIPLLGVLARRPAPSRWAAAWAGLLCGLPFHASQLAGLLQAPWSPARPLVALIAVLLAAGVAGFAVLVAEVARRRGPRAALAAAPPGWVALEAVAGHPPFEIAWLDLGAVAAGEPWLLGLASFGGAPLLAASILALDGAALCVGGALVRRTPPPVGALATALAIAAAGALAALRPAGAGPSLAVAVVQPDTPAARRHGAEVLDPNLRALLALSERAVADGPDLVVWPETAWDGAAARGGDRFLGVVARTLATPLVAGARTRGPRGLRNAAVLATPAGEVRPVAAKRHPVPAYEGAPGGPVARALARRGLWPGRVVAGAPPAPFALDAAATSPHLGALICSDLHDPRLAGRLRRAGARMLLVLANEADLGPSSRAAAERLARLRAAEHRVAVVRVANNGRSLWIDGRGRVVSALGRGRADAGSAAVAVGAAPPLYSTAGSAPALALFVPLAALGLAGVPRAHASRRAPPGSPALPNSRRFP